MPPGPFRGKSQCEQKTLEYLVECSGRTERGDRVSGPNKLQLSSGFRHQPLISRSANPKMRLKHT